MMRSHAWPRRHVPGALRLALAMAFWPPAALAEEPAPSVSTPALPAPQSPALHTISFEGKEATVTLGSTRSSSCRVPCEFHVLPGVYKLAIDGRSDHTVLVGAEDQVTVVRLRAGSPGMIYGGVTAFVVGVGLFAAGCAMAAASCEGTWCEVGQEMKGFPLEVIGVIAGAAGITLGVLGAVNTARVVVDRERVEPVVQRTPRVLPWATAEDRFHGAVGGLAIMF
jgi:hypothetical protein